MAKTAGSWVSWAVLGTLGAALALQPLGCGGTDDTPVDERFVADVLADVGPLVVEPALADFLVQAAALTAAAEAWRDAAPADTPDRKADAQQAYLTAMRSWQRVEVLQIGPLGSSLTAVAGDDGRDEIYSWDTINPCRVDQETAHAEWDDEGFFAATLVNAKGLDAIEHLLWAGPDNACPSRIDINTDGTWDALGPDGVEANRAAFAAALAGELTERAQERADQWADRFSQQLADAGDSDPYETATDGLNAVYDALFYLEIAVKDRKLAVPLGLRDCTEGCGTLAEGVATDDSHTWIQENLAGFEALLTGGGGFGVDDLLRERGHADVADQLVLDLAAARAAAQAVQSPIHEAVTSDREGVMALHDAIRAITDTLKGDVATVLSLTLPAEAAGDAD